ncbi:MAG: V-type ATP synthase subunit E [bacterium]
MSLDKIIEHIDAEIRQKNEQIRGEAREKAERIRRQSTEDAAMKKEEILKQARKNAAERERRMLQMAQLAGRKAILTEKQNALTSLFAAALDKLAGLDQARYKRVLKNMLMKTVKSGREELIVSARDKKNLDRNWLDEVNRQLLKERGIQGKLRFSDEARDMKGGFVLREGQIEINSSFEALLKYNQNELEIEVADSLSWKS